MRIGELAALLGVTTRTVRHYHQQGVLPEPPRRVNGYREYGMRDAVALARVRRLVELGFSLDRVRDLVADDRSKALPALLNELDADLARQEAEIRARRARLAVLLGKAEALAEAGELGADDAVSPELAAVLRQVETPSSQTAQWDRDILMLLESMAAPDSRERSAERYAALAADPALLARGRDFYRRLDELADAEPDDPRVSQLAAELAHYTAEHLLAPSGSGAGEGDPEASSGSGADEWNPEAIEPFLRELAPAQAEVIRQIVRSIADLFHPQRTTMGDTS